MKGQSRYRSIRVYMLVIIVVALMARGIRGDGWRRPIMTTMITVGVLWAMRKRIYQAGESPGSR